MSEGERQELIEAVAECAPKEMGATIIGEPSQIHVYFGADCSVLTLNPESNEGAACFAMLDAIELAGEHPVLERKNCGVKDAKRIGPHYKCWSAPPGFFSSSNQNDCTSRAEAVARAFISVFARTKEQQ